MQTDTVGISSVIPYARNPRRNDAAIAKVAASLQEFGWRQPIVVDEDMVVVAGHTRLEAARTLNMEEVPIHIAHGLTPEQIKAYRLADNRVGQEAEWDEELLRLELGELEGMDFALDLTGFDTDELAQFMAEPIEEGLTDPDEVPEVPEEPVTVLGDLWLLGNHRLVCGDSTSADDVEKVLNGVKPHLMVTDPPYGVNYDANWRNEADRANGKPIGGRALGAVLNDDRADWREAWALFPGDVAYVWHAGNKANVVADSLIACDLDIRAQIIWAKNNIVIGRGDYHPKHEPCWYAVRKNRKGHYCGGRKQSTVWEIDKPMKSETGHSTQKPVECMRRPIVNNSSVGQAVYEPFSGSGTTIIAAQMEGRGCYAIELNPAYVDVAIKRWQDFTGADATLEATGQTYNQLVDKKRHGNTDTIYAPPPAA
jgi:DNA modification methylase